MAADKSAVNKVASAKAHEADFAVQIAASALTSVNAEADELRRAGRAASEQGKKVAAERAKEGSQRVAAAERREQVANSKAEAARIAAEDAKLRSSP